MKRRKYFIKLFLLPLLAAIGMITMSCTSDSVDDTPAYLLEEVGDVDNLIGVIHYDAAINNWYVCTINSDGGEGIRYNIFSELSSDFQQENLQVRFSGEIRQWVKEYIQPPLTDYQVIFISSIQVEQ